MKKHFLLLLMAFFSLAGWAQTDISVGWSISLSAANATYTGASLTPIVTLTKEGEEPIPSNKFNVEWFKDGESLGATPELINVSETGYTVKVTGDITNTYGDLATDTKKFWILKANATQTTAGAVADETTFAALAGGSLTLVKTAPVVNFGQTTIEYSVDGGEWSTTIPTASKVGNYVVSYRVPGTSNYNALAATEIGTARITGNDLVENTDFTAPTALAGGDISFDNANHALINAGEALTANCTMKYKLGDDGEWQTTVPQAKDVATYTVYWKAEAIDGYYDATGNFTQKIVAAAPTVNAITAATGTLTYTGLAQNLLSAEGTATIGATPVYTIQYKATAAADYPVAGDPVAYAEVKGINAGFYQITPKVVAGGNYIGVEGEPIEVQINKAELTVIPENKTKVYGSDIALPTFTATYTGFKNGETAETAAVTAPTFTCKVSEEALAADVTAGTGVGEYKIKAQAETGTAANYTLVVDETKFGTLEITQRELKDAAPFTFTLTDGALVYTGEALTTTIATATFGGVEMNNPADYVFVTTNNTNVGTANVIISGQGNFKGSIVKTFNITAKPVYIKPKNNSKAYGAAEPNPLTTFDLVAAPGGDAIAGATLNGTATFARIAGENVGTYKIYVKAFTPGVGAAGNYTIAPDQVLNNPESADAKNLTALFTVTPASGELVLKFKDDIEAAKKTKVYGEANPVWTVADLEVVSGLIDGDDEADVLASLSAPKFDIASENVVNAEQNKVTLTSGLVSANYPTVTVQPMDFTVTKRPITVTVENQAITYGAALADPVENVNWSVTEGTVIGTDVLGVTLKTVNDLLTYNVSTEAHVDAITAEITNTNYDLTVENGDLTVSAGAAITLNREGDMDALISAYDGQNINVTLDRNITRTEAWFAMVLPFETSVTELSQKYGYAVVNVLNTANEDASKVKFKLHMQTIPANTPFLIKIATAKSEAMNFGPKAIVYAADPESHDKAGNEFHGVFKSTILEASDYLWTMVPAQNKFVKLNDAGTTLTPINAYLKTKNNLDAFAPVITVEDFDFASGTTSIKTLNAETMNAFSADGWYNLNGTKLQGVPTQKGVYIQNGKKVIIK